MKARRRTPGHRLLPTEAVQAIGDLGLIARVVVEGFLSGEHPDRRPGPGVEFQQYRSYEPGDDPRRLDWKLLARSGRLYVRDAEVERDVTVRLVVDASASMAYQEGGTSKLDYARYLAACMAYLADRQGDRVALNLLGRGASVDLAPSLRGAAVARVLAALEAAEAVGSVPSGEALCAACCNRREREIVVLLSDLYDADGEFWAALETWRALGHDVYVLQLVGAEERAWSRRGDFEFVDLETGERLTGDAGALAAGYRERLEAFLSSCRDRALARGAVYRLADITEPLDGVLRSVLLRRGAA